VASVKIWPFSLAGAVGQVRRFRATSWLGQLGKGEYVKRSKWLVAVSALSALMLTAAACGGDDDGDGGGGGSEAVEKTPVTVYFQGALTGPYNYLVIPAFQGAQLAFDELNADDSFPAEITFKEGDTQGNPDQAPPVVEEVAGDTETVAVVGPAFSGESAVSGDTYNDSGIPFLTPSATGVALAEEDWDYWYRVIGNDGAQGTLAGQFLAREVGAKQLFIANDKSEYGQPLSETVAEVAEEEGVEIVDTQGVEAGAANYNSLISAVEASGADSLFFGGYDADFANIVSQADEAGLDIEMMSGDGSLSSTFLENAGDAAEGVYLSAPTDLGGDFIDKYNEEYGGEASSVPIYAGDGYDAASLIGEGIRAAVDEGASSPEEIREGIQTYLTGLTPDAPFEGAVKSYAFDEETHELTSEDTAALFYYYQVKNGEMSPLGNGSDLGLESE
jgi:branched-chain amino acid transport system substrate-binding protein